MAQMLDLKNMLTMVLAAIGDKGDPQKKRELEQKLERVNRQLHLLDEAGDTAGLWKALFPGC